MAVEIFQAAIAKAKPAAITPVPANTSRTSDKSSGSRSHIGRLLEGLKAKRARKEDERLRARMLPDPNPPMPSAAQLQPRFAIEMLKIHEYIPLM